MNTVEPRAEVLHRVWSTVLCLLLPLALLGGAVMWAVALMPSLPSQIAVHWNARGEVDGFGEPGTYVFVLSLMVVVFALIMWAVAFFSGVSGVTRRATAGISVWFASAFSALIVGSLMIQLPAGGAEAADISAVLAWSLGGAALPAFLAALVMPADRPLPAVLPVAEDALRLNLANGETAAWTRTVRSPWSRWIVAIGLVAVAVSLMLWRDLAMPILFLAVSLSMFTVLTEWRVTVDQAGFRARTLLPIFTVSVPLDEVESAETTSVSPFADFGGWGVRVGRVGTVGVIVRAGLALRVRRTGGRTVVVTVDDASTAARLLNSLADRDRLR